MREIKFRVWNGEEMIYSGSNLDENNRLDLFFCAFGLPKSKLMQYTGLKSKSGVDIYEGDILLEDRDKIIVEFSDEIDTDGYGWASGWSLGEKPFEVIGNIYENPELLDNKN